MGANENKVLVCVRNWIRILLHWVKNDGGKYCQNVFKSCERYKEGIAVAFLE